MAAPPPPPPGAHSPAAAQPLSVEDLATLHRTVAALMSARVDEARVRSLIAADTFDRELWAELAAMGLVGLLVDAEHGGAAAGPAAAAVVAEELGRVLAVTPFLATAFLVPALLDAVGDDAECAAVLPAIAAGELVATAAFAEGGSARPPATPRTTARRGGPGGEPWRVSGEKRFVLDGGCAELIYVLAGTDAGPAVLAVRAGAPGLRVSGLQTVDATRKLAAIRLDDTPARLIGEPGPAAAVFTAAVDCAATGLMAEQAGGARRVTDMARDYAKARFQFGRAIGSFQAVKHLCADMLLEAESAVSAARHAAASLAAGAPDRLTDLALAQAYCSDAYVFTAATNIQVHGGIGFTWEHPAHLYLRRARGDAQLFGSPAWHRERYIEQIGGER